MGLSFNYFNPSEGFENELNAGLLFFPYGPLYAFLMSTMALEILSLVMFIPFYLGNILSLTVVLVAPYHISPLLFLLLRPDLKRKKRKSTCVPWSFVKTLWHHLVSANVTGRCTDGHKRTFVKSGERYSTETLISSPLLWSCLENNYEQALFRLYGGLVRGRRF